MSLNGTLPSPLPETRKGDVLTVGVHPWYVKDLPPSVLSLPSPAPEKTGVYDVDFKAMVKASLSTLTCANHPPQCKPSPLSTLLTSAYTSLLPHTPTFLGECGLDKVSWKRDPETHFPQIHVFLAHAMLGLPMSLHVVKSGREVRACLEEAWGWRGGDGNNTITPPPPPPFVIVHGFCFRKQEVLEWTNFESRIRARHSSPSFKVYFGLCPRHVKSSVPYEVHERCLLESDMGPEGNGGDQREVLKVAAGMCDGGVKAEGRGGEVLRVLEGMQEGGKESV